MNTVECVKSAEIMKFDMHTHPDEWEISLQLSGSMDVELGDVKENMKPGMVRIIPPGTPHCGETHILSTDIFLRAENLDFSDIIITEDVDGSIGCLFEMLNKIMTEKEENYAHIADSLTEVICQYIKKNTKSEYRYKFVSDFKNMLYDNIGNADFSISEEIKKTGFNRDYFRRCFKEDMGKTPLEYLTDLRINLAKKLLVQIMFSSVELVAVQCGYKDIYYFSKSFKKITGVSPREYRNQHQTK